MKIFVLILGVVQLCAASLKPQMHFTEVDHAIGGKFSDPFEVESFTACGHRALGRKAIGFRMRAKEGEEAGECRVLEEFEFFEENTEGDAFYFIADVRRKDATTCSDNAGEESVMEVLSGRGECGEGEFCERWTKMRDTCKASGHENCYKSADLPSTTTPEPKTPCSQGWNLSDGRKQCCPPSYEYSDVYQKCLGMINIGNVTTQEDINAVCRNTGGVPVSIANAEQNKELRTRFKPKTAAIIGYQIPVGKEWTKEGFRWVDGAKNSYTNWFTGNPNNNNGDDRMVVTSKDGFWIDISLIVITSDIQIICMSKAIPAAFSAILIMQRASFATINTFDLTSRLVLSNKKLSD